jgi:murein DD-endopeptidase MepM/ murein hydrolase activator NlpD
MTRSLQARWRAAAGLGVALLVAACGPALTYPRGAPRIYSEYLDLQGCSHGIFGGRRDAPHSGLDIEVPLGHPVLAAAHGVVLFSGRDRGGGGQTITIEHGQDAEGNRIRTVYLHNEENLVRVGQEVRRGELIARAGKTTWRHVNPHEYWLDDRIICFDASKQFSESRVRFTYPVACTL